VAYAPVVLNLPLYVALDRGWFQEAGVEVEPIAFTTANDMINALVAGQADVVTGVSLVPVINLESEGPGRVRVMTHSRMDQAHPYDGLVVKKDSRIRQLGGLTAQLDAARAICDAVDRMIG
jgi:NitT/TauT family transport system substrate-binding protein